ncbi:MAG: leucine-rich repeat protein [Dorea longicatena]
MTEIGEEAFYFCGIEELELPTNLKIIGDSAFSDAKTSELFIYRQVCGRLAAGHFTDAADWSA